MSASNVVMFDAPTSQWKDVPRAHLRFQNVSFHVDLKKVVDGKKTKVRKQILSDISGDVLPGECLVIMGPTGCGKTTFLDAIADKIGSGHLSGEILVNNQPRDKFFHRYAAYVQQFDSFLPTLTVEETLKIAAKLGLPRHLIKEEINAEVDAILDELGLKSIRGSRVGGGIFPGISGGQRKRLSIGVELISRPSLIFLDEPTTGLDSASAYNVMEKIKDLTKFNCTVLTTIHQPSFEMFELFDKLLLLSVGQTVYFGPASSALSFFELAGYPNPPYSNPADHFLDLINVDFVSDFGTVDIPQIIEAYRTSPLCEQFKKRDSATMPIVYDDLYASQAIPQLYILCYRNFLSALRNPLMYWSRVFAYTMLGLVMGSLYYDIGYADTAVQDRVSVLFFVAAFLTFMSVSAIPTFLEEKEVFLRERQNGAYRVWVYVVANFLISIPFIFITAFSTSVALYFLVDLNSSPERFWYFVMYLFLALCTAESIVVSISAVVSQALVGIAGAAGVFGVFMLVCGFFVIKPNIPDYWIWVHYISFHTYVFEGFMYNDFKGLTFADGNSGEDILKSTFDITEDNRAADAIILFAMVVIYKIIFYLLLQFYQTGKK